MCVLMKNVKTKTVKSYIYLNIANRNDAMARVLSVHYRICTLFSEYSDFSDNVQSLFRQCSESVQTMFRMFKICSEFSDNVQNIQNLFRLFHKC